MRVLVTTDAIGALSSAEAGAALAEGWPGARVVPAGAAGAGFGQAYADLIGAELTTGMCRDLPAWSATSDGVVAVGLVAGAAEDPEPIPFGASSTALGEALATALRAAGRTPSRVVLDLSAGELAHDGGAGLLAALGATADVPLDRGVAGLDGIGRIDLTPVRELLGDAELVGVLPAAQAAQRLLGLRGITSTRRGGLDPAGLDPALLLRTDAELERLAGLLAVTDRPGAGACGGTALAVLALGGRLTTGPELAHQAVAADRLDLVVSGCGVFDFAQRGGEVVAAAARLAERSLCPAIVVSGAVLIGGREMRTLGIESAYPVRTSTADDPTADDVSAEELAATARRVARSWRW